MALAVQLQLNPRAKPFVPTVKANKLLQHRRGKREEGEAPVSKHQTQLGRVRWASRRGEGKPNPPRETKNSGANGGRNWRTEVFVQKIIRLRAGEGIRWLAAGTMPNSLYRMPLAYRSLTCVFCYSCSFLFVVCVFVFFFALIGAW